MDETTKNKLPSTKTPLFVDETTKNKLLGPNGAAVAGKLELLDSRSCWRVGGFVCYKKILSLKRCGLKDKMVFDKLGWPAVWPAAFAISRLLFSLG